MDRLEMVNGTGANATNITTASSPQPPTTTAVTDLPSLLSFLYDHRHMFFIEARLLALTLSIIYIGAHGALQRPYSAAPKEDKDEDDAADEEADSNVDKKKKRKKRKRRKDAQANKEGLQASDAIMLPFFAAFALAGLYYLIQYLQDPALLNRIVRAYTSLVAVASVGKLLGDALHLAATVVFPNVWAAKSGASTTLFRIDAAHRRQLRRQVTAGADDGEGDASWTADPSRKTPFPDRVAVWLPTKNAAFRRLAWTLRRLLREEWSVRVALHGVGSTELEGGLTLASALGVLLSAVATYLYYFVGVFPNALNNLLGLGFCYGGLLLVSCTSFAIGSLVLVGLFVYDIVMVFYTPFMVTVATKLDAPIKLVAQSGNRSSLLGLGDIVVPGIFICLCLRYDLHRYYAAQIRRVETELETETKTEGATAANDGTAGNTATTTTTTTTAKAMREVKATYVDPQGRWGDKYWTTTSLVGLLRSSRAPTPGLRAAQFPKPYFCAAMVSYVVGLLSAMVAMLYTGKGQPALLYLVPALVLTVWGRAVWAGDLRDMWAYTEDGALDVKDVVVEVGPDGKPVEKAKEEDKDTKIKQEEKEDDKTKAKKEEEDEITEENENEDEGHDVFLFAVRAPAASDATEVDI